MRTASLVACCALLSAGLASGQADADQVLKTEKALHEAKIHSDVAALDRIMGRFLFIQTYVKRGGRWQVLSIAHVFHVNPNTMHTEDPGGPEAVQLPAVRCLTPLPADTRASSSSNWGT